jgi:glycosyltransferase involved in cell wall biosynthesis
VPGYEHLVVSTPCDHAQYIRKTQSSTVVFNTPAVLRCHGWKLAEFLALGKAIISTPLERLLPAPLEMGRDIHYVDPVSVDSIRDAVERIRGDDAYRRHLEEGARQYYVKYLQPAAVIRRILSAAASPNNYPDDHVMNSCQPTAN